MPALSCRLLQMLLEVPWPNSTSFAAGYQLPVCEGQQPTWIDSPLQAAATVSGTLRLLQDLLAAHPAAQQLLSAVLQSSSEVADVMTAGLSCGLQPVTLPVLK
jgi:hypothetical protein